MPYSKDKFRFIEMDSNFTYMILWEQPEQIKKPLTVLRGMTEIWCWKMSEVFYYYVFENEQRQKVF